MSLRAGECSPAVSHIVLIRFIPSFSLVGVALSVAVLGGCSALPAVGPDYVRPVTTLPDAWTAPQGAGQDAALETWWRQFGDPQLDQLVDAALAGSADLRQAEARLRQARAARQQAVSGLFPTLSTSAGVARNRYASAVSAVPPRTTWDAGFDASWELDLFGGTRRGVETASAELEASAASLANVRVSLVAEVAQNYVELRLYERRLAIARANLASQAETLQITEWRGQAGLVSGTDVAQARTSLAQTRATIPDLEVSLAGAANRLAVLTGQPPGSLQARLAGDGRLPVLPAGVASGIPADVLRQRPDLIVAERTLAAETARVGQKLAQRFPSLNLAASFGWQAFSLPGLGSAGSLARSASGSLAATLFDAGRLEAAVDVQTAVQAEALAAYQAAVLAALEEVENALTAYAADRERVDARRTAAASAQEAAVLARDQYQAGLADFQKVLETQRTQLSAEDSLALAEGSMRTNLIKLYKALGGGWQATTTARDEAGR